MILASFAFLSYRREQRAAAEPARHAGGFFPSEPELAHLVVRIPLRAPAVPPPQPRAKDRISIGGPSRERRKDLILRRDEDLASPPEGRPENLASAQKGPGQPEPPSAAARQGASPATRPDGAGAARATQEAGPSIASSLRNWERRLGEGGGAWGVPGGAGKQMGPLFFDPEGADFTSWINHFKNEVYRNWIVPEAALFGFRGHVDFEFSVERNGHLTGLKLLLPSGTVALDRAAQNALLGSRLLPLPQDFAPPSVTMRVTFFYNEGPKGS